MEKRSNFKGQVTVLVLLLSLLGLMVSLSALSRSITDVRQVTVVDAGTKAFAAAEAGVQFALDEVTQNPALAATHCGSGNEATVSLAAVSLQSDLESLKYETCSDSESFSVGKNVAPGDVFQVETVPKSPGNIKYANVIWSNNAAAVEVVVLYLDNSDNYKIARYLFTGTLVSNATNEFSPASSASNCINTNLDSGGVPRCSAPGFSLGSCINGIPNISSAKLIRVKPLYASTNIMVCGSSVGNSPGRLSPRAYTITATARTKTGVVKKIRINRTPATMPSFFDNVLFASGGVSR